MKTKEHIELIKFQIQKTAMNLVISTSHAKKNSLNPTAELFYQLYILKPRSPRPRLNSANPTEKDNKVKNMYPLKTIPLNKN